MVLHVRLWYLCLLLFMFMIMASVAHAQNITDPAEARIINAMFSEWGIRPSVVTNMGWNISGELCSGAAVDSTDFDSNAYNPAIKCDCNFPDSICHITRLKVYALDAVGPIPEGLWNLTYLTNLNLAQNYLTGPLSPSIGNLIQMQWLTFGINALSGEIPPELGLLTDLRSLSFGTNNFNGSLPSELGNLRRLQQLYINSAGISGDIPSSFANLQSLVTVWASDNRFTGRIPNFIGNWTQLQSLRFEGNSFAGSIPPSFSRLTSLQELRITSLTNGTLDFIANLKSLTVLVLRNSRISGSIPTDIGEYQNLTRLDLSFNNLTGQIPRDLFNLSQIAFLFLGNNSLNGTLPNVKSRSLLNIDLSYNELSGTLPSWVNESSLQLNLVVNNFTLEGSEISGIPSGLNCLQRDFPCNRDTPRYSSFGINCGGPQITSSNQIIYEWDNATLGPATYYLTSERRWGVSNVGQRDNPAYITSSSRQFTNTLDSELFQTARISAGSLRYYGLGLENGNYTVNLQFAELLIEDGQTWRSRGRRIFDIYLQGNLEFQDFDIKQEAGGASFRPVTRAATVQVSNNYLEIHLFWFGKGTCCVPNQGTFGPLISAISATPRDNSLSLSWSTRFEVCLGVARGLAYLHEESRIRVVHRDVKASNVLLDSDLIPKISDFGLAKLYDEKQTHMSTRVAGTIGYLAPEYAMRGHLTEKADVFGFGVVALEIISRRSNSDSTLEDEKIYLLEWAWNLHEANTELELVDEKLSEYDENEVRRVIKIALLCTQTSPMQRPSMSRVVAMLSGDIEASGAITRPEYLTGFNFKDSTTFKSVPPVSTTNSAASTSHSTGTPLSPNNISRPMLHDIIGEGR